MRLPSYRAGIRNEGNSLCSNSWPLASILVSYRTDRTYNLETKTNLISISVLKFPRFISRFVGIVNGLTLMASYYCSTRNLYSYQILSFSNIE